MHTANRHSARWPNRWLMFAASLALATAAWADKYDEAIASFKPSPKSGTFF